MITPKDYATALEVQDASNIIAVSREYAEVLGRIAKFFEDTNDSQLPLAELNRHPIAVMYASKLAALTGVQGDGSSSFDDLRAADGMELLVTVQVLTFALVQLHTVAAVRPIDQPLDKHMLCQALAKRCEQLTAAGSLQVFSLAYEACQAGSTWEEESVLASETWLHQVMSPQVPAKPAADWQCVCGAIGTTDGLLYDATNGQFLCPICKSADVEPKSAMLKAELKDPRALAYALELRKNRS